MPLISNYRRIGIECELRNLCFNRLPASGPRNKTVLAASAAKENVSDDPSDSHPCVKAVMEGNDSGINIIELVFGPLPDSLLGNVIDVVSIASKIDINAIKGVSGKRSGYTFADWIAAFNKCLNPKLQNFRLTADPRFADLAMKPISATSGSPSRQANITVPVSVFADKRKLKELTDGFKPFFSFPIETIPEMVQKEIGSATPPFPNTPVATGILSLAVYFITLYATRRQPLNSPAVDKYLFHILPKVDLVALTRKAFLSSVSEIDTQRRSFIEKVLTCVCNKITACEPSPRTDVIKKSIDLLMSQTFDTQNCVINPRPTGVLPVYSIAGSNSPAIVVELRSGSLTLLNNILKGYSPVSIWKNP